jgi:CRP-like cAMP-binding protein
MAFRSELIRLFDHDPELLRHVPQALADEIRDRAVVESLVFPPGKLDVPVRHGGPTDLGFYVVDGLLLRRVDVLGRRAVELLGSGDFVRTWRNENPGTLPCQHGWTVASETRVAVLDQRFLRAAASWPGVVPELVQRLSERPAKLGVQLAIAQLPRLDLRLLLLFWRLADRWGTVRSDGVALRLRLSQETLGELVAARRSSVNAALRELRVRGLVANPSPGVWLLLGPPPVEWHDQTGTMPLAEPVG